MKALSLRQPWAWMVVYAGKAIENRRWPTKFRGPFLVHAAKGMTRREYDEAVAFARSVDPQIKVPSMGTLERGGIIGKAELIDVLPPCDPERFEQFVFGCIHRWHMRGQYGFVLADIEPLPFREIAGMLGFFEVGP